MIHDPPSEIARDFMGQVEHGAIHTLTPMAQACAEVRAYQQRKRIPIHSASADMTRLLLGLSAIGTGLEQIKRGKVESGIACAEHGYAFLRRELGR